MDNFTYNTKIPLQILAVLNKNRQKIIQTYATETLYKESDIDLLWTDLETYLNHFNKAFENKQKIWQLEKTMYQDFERKSLYIRKKHGKVLICLPYNAVIPLLPIFIISFCVFGNAVILSPSRKSLQTAKFILNILDDLFQKNDFQIDLFENGGKEAIEKLVVTKQVDLLFFQGSSRNRNEIYNQCVSNGIELIYEGEGQQVTIIDNYIGNNAHTTLTAINQYISLCNGKLCTTPQIIFANSTIFNELNDNQQIFVKYDTLDEMFDYLKNNYDYGLQISVFSSRENEIAQRIYEEINISRITINMNPTFQNSLLPWGGYKKSGYSRVCDFFDKATKTLIIESN